MNLNKQDRLIRIDGLCWCDKCRGVHEDVAYPFAMLADDEDEKQEPCPGKLRRPIYYLVREEGKA